MNSDEVTVLLKHIETRQQNKKHNATTKTSIFSKSNTIILMRVHMHRIYGLNNIDASSYAQDLWANAATAITTSSSTTCHQVVTT